MKTHSIAEILSAHEFFSDMKPEHIEFISGCAKVSHFASGKFMILAGEPADNFYLIRSGHTAVEIEIGNQVRTIHSPGPGEFVGWSWILPPARWRYDVRVVEDVSAISFDAECVRKKCEADFEFGYHIYRRILKIVIERLMATRIQMIDMYA
ncbi:MAG: cyclic nucleotide-binding domain-containing protein [Bacteroidetes bacterium]|nr:cyclic nucleotide-binding domain-containing protein [Bacteroidota bacterium]